MFARKLFVVAVLTVFLAAAAPSRAAEPAAEEVTAESLIAGIPVLSPENQELKSYRFVCDLLSLSDGLAISMDLAWARPDRLRCVVTTGDDAFPVACFANRDGFIFDAADGSVLIQKGGLAGISCSLSTAEDLSKWLYLKFGWCFGSKYRFIPSRLDFPGVFGSEQVSKKLSRHESGAWVLDMQSKQSHGVAVFNQRPPHSLVDFKNIVIDADFAFRFRSIQINQTNSLASQRFPNQSEFPPGLQVRDCRQLLIEITGNLDREQQEKAINDRMYEVMRVQGAIHDPKIRLKMNKDEEFWRQAEKNYKIYGPALRELVKFEPPTQASAPKSSRYE
jgi:hypothetical protein